MRRDEAMNRKKVQFQLSLTEFLYNGCFAAANFLSVFLTAIGFSAGQMGLITAALNGVSILSQPTWGVISDRIRSVKRCFMLCMAGMMQMQNCNIPLWYQHNWKSKQVVQQRLPVNQQF